MCHSPWGVLVGMSDGSLLLSLQLLPPPSKLLASATSLNNSTKWIVAKGKHKKGITKIAAREPCWIVTLAQESRAILWRVTQNNSAPPETKVQSDVIEIHEV